MQTLIVGLVLVGLSAGLPQQSFFPYRTPIKTFPVSVQKVPVRQFPSPKPIAILRMTQDVNYDGTYSYGFESENGIAVESKGLVRNQGTEDETHVASGSYTYVSPEGKRITTNWYADDTGFHAEGDHLPKPPEVRIFATSV